MRAFLNMSAPRCASAIPLSASPLATAALPWSTPLRSTRKAARFPARHPEYQTFTENLGAGRHAVAFLVNHTGVSTRILEGVDPFLACAVQQDGSALPVTWKCTRLTGYAAAVRRVNPQVGFIEWCDTREVPDWRGAEFDDRDWSTPVTVSRAIGTPRPCTAANPRAIAHALKPIASGEFTETFGYERDDLPARFFLRDLAPASLPPQGVWRRYDLGRVRLMRPNSRNWSP